MPINPLKDLERLRQRYNISIHEDQRLTDHKLFEKYIFRNPQPYLNYKKSCDINRTLVKSNFKPKLKTGIDKRKDAVLAIFDQISENDQTLKRLGKELELLQKCNKDLYRLQIRDYQRVVEVKENGASVTEVARMI